MLGYAGMVENDGQQDENASGQDGHGKAMGSTYITRTTHTFGQLLNNLGEQ